MGASGCLVLPRPKTQPIWAGRLGCIPHFGAARAKTIGLCVHRPQKGMHPAVHNNCSKRFISCYTQNRPRRHCCRYSTAKCRQKHEPQMEELKSKTGALSSTGQEVNNSEAADILLIGHVTRDVFGDPADHVYRQGGTVSFAASAALGLGRRPSIITRAASRQHLAELPPEVDICLLPSDVTTTFDNIYTPEGRIQYCYAAALAIGAADIPLRLQHPRAVLLGPLVQEIPAEVAASFG